MLKLLTANIWLKLLALTLGVLIWLHVVTEKESTFVITLPMGSVTLKDQLAVISQLPDSVTLKVSGTGKEYLRRQWEECRIRVSAISLTAGEHTLLLSSSNTFIEPSGTEFEVKEILSPERLDLQIDHEGSRSLTVVPTISGQVDDGFLLEHNIVMKPASVLVHGPQSAIDSLKEIRTEPIRLHGLRNEIQTTAMLLSPSRRLRLQPERVEVHLTIVPAISRTFSNVQVNLFNSPSDETVQLEPSKIDVELFGPKKLLDTLQASQIHVSADYRKANTERRVVLTVDPPRDCKANKLSVQSCRLVE